MVSVHDNLVYAQHVDYEARRVVLHTLYLRSDPPEYTDIVFTGVIAYHAEQQAFHSGGLLGNVLFSAEESDAAFVLGQYSKALAAAKDYGWPVRGYSDLGDLAARLTSGGAKCFEIHGSCGLSGFVFAESMEFHSRPSRACVGDAEPHDGPGNQ